MFAVITQSAWAEPILQLRAYVSCTTPPETGEAKLANAEDEVRELSITNSTISVDWRGH